jgi:cyclopropane fatty-acyl-phospholipid synthase-like methyltransferase
VGPRSTPAYWDERAQQASDKSANGLCRDGQPLTPEEHRRLYVDPLTAALELDDTVRLLEIGCGTGLNLNAFDGLVAQMAGTDFSASMLGRYRGPAETVVCPADQVPDLRRVPPPFDRVLLAQVVQYFPSAAYFQRSMSVVRGLLAPRGLMVLTHVMTHPPVPVGRRARLRALLGDRGPYRWYPEQRLRGVLEPLGFSVEIRPEPSAPPFDWQFVVARLPE